MPHPTKATEAAEVARFLETTGKTRDECKAAYKRFLMLVPRETGGLSLDGMSDAQSDEACEVSGISAALRTDWLYGVIANEWEAARAAFKAAAVTA